MCFLNCTADQYANGAVNESECLCVDKFLWNSQDFKCMIDCPNQPFNNGTKDGSVDECLCEANFLWNATALDCDLDCTNFQYTVGPAMNDTCECE